MPMDVKDYFVRKICEYGWREGWKGYTGDAFWRNGGDRGMNWEGQTVYPAVKKWVDENIVDYRVVTVMGKAKPTDPPLPDAYFSVNLRNESRTDPVSFSPGESITLSEESSFTLTSEAQASCTFTQEDGFALELEGSGVHHTMQVAFGLTLTLGMSGTTTHRVERQFAWNVSRDVGPRKQGRFEMFVLRKKVVVPIKMTLTPILRKGKGSRVFVDEFQGRNEFNIDFIPPEDQELTYEYNLGTDLAYDVQIRYSETPLDAQ